MARVLHYTPSQKLVFKYHQTLHLFGLKEETNDDQRKVPPRKAKFKVGYAPVTAPNRRQIIKAWIESASLNEMQLLCGRIQRARQRGRERLRETEECFLGSCSIKSILLDRIKRGRLLECLMWPVKLTAGKGWRHIQANVLTRSLVAPILIPAHYARL
ncbi:Hypothetical predicted protein [Xyrichtys novacula]|uniref:Uncharacterized protein n=1 Tax=Xyrichtys novacula TaxID=13765 RepID=A0AAV1EVY5_XYRNO|nr:Hypothetical predicted protein [Xyrichtys novacula]